MDFTALKFPGDDVDALGEWIHQVERSAKNAIEQGIPEHVVYSTLWNQVRQSTAMHTKLEVYQHTTLEHKRWWMDLVRIAQDILDIGRADRLREQHEAHVQTPSNGQPRGGGQQAPTNAVPVPLPSPPASPSAASTRDKGDNKSWAKGDNKGSGKGSGQGSGQQVNGSANHE